MAGFVILAYKLIAVVSVAIHFFRQCQADLERRMLYITFDKVCSKSLC